MKTTLEQQDLLDKTYKNYRSKSKDLDLPENLYNKLIDDLNKEAMFPIDNPNRMLSQEQFINKCKTDPEFSEKWELKIEEKELSLVEMIKLAKYENAEELIKTRKENIQQISERLSNDNIPTKLITVKYKNETIESYE